VSHFYSDTIPRSRGLPITRPVGTAMARKKISTYQQNLSAAKLENQKLRRELRVLRRLRFRMEDQTESVRTSLKLINHVSP
jgi:hypothetical protein